MWILLWVFIHSSGDVKHYHLGTFNNQKDCELAQKESMVLITAKGMAIECIDGNAKAN